MSIFYRGVGIDTYWSLNNNNPTEIGFTARAPEVAPTTVRLIQHISIGRLTFVRALRDAEILAYGTIPATCVVNCFDVYVDMHLSQ